MIEHLTDNEMADLYVRNKLTAKDEADFELLMLQSPQLQEHVQAALAIQESLKLEPELEEAPSENQEGERQFAGGPWGSLALAASVLLAVVSTVMLARSSIESGQLKLQIAELSQPQTSVLYVPVNIMRSLGTGSADVIVQKPPDGSIIQLDIELNEQSRNLAVLNFTLLNDMEDAILSWQASPLANGRTTALLRSEQISAGVGELKITDIDDNVLDRRLLEFR